MLNGAILDVVTEFMVLSVALDDKRTVASFIISKTGSASNKRETM